MNTPALGYNHLDPGHPDNLHTYAICGAHTKVSNLEHEICQNKAGKGTSHEGLGRCKFHGGASLSGPDHPLWNGGRQADRWKQRIKAALELYEPYEEGEDPLNLAYELKVQRFLMGLVLERVLDEHMNKEELADMVHLTTVIAPAAGDSPAQADTDSDALIVDGNENETSIAIGVGRSGGSKSKHNRKSSSSKPRAQLATLDEKLALIKDLTDSIVNLVSRVIAARNQTALTRAELVWLQTGMVGLINEFIEDPERRRAFISRLVALLPVGDAGQAAAEDHKPTRRNRLPPATQAAEAD